MPHRTRVLVVDSDQDMVDALLVLLDAEGYDAKGVYSARTIIAEFQKFDPDVMIMDIAMQGKARWNAARGKRPMFIAVTGEYTKGADRLRAELSGFDYYLIKPCDPMVLLKLVASYPYTHTRPQPEGQFLRV